MVVDMIAWLVGLLNTNDPCLPCHCFCSDARQMWPRQPRTKCTHGLAPHLNGTCHIRTCNWSLPKLSEQRRNRTTPQATSIKQHQLRRSSKCYGYYSSLLVFILFCSFFVKQGVSAYAVPHYQKCCTRVTHIWGDRKGQPNRSAMERPRPGRTSYVINVNSCAR